MREEKITTTTTQSLQNKVCICARISNDLRTNERLRIGLNKSVNEKIAGYFTKTKNCEY